jgi:polar amino acid transport system permease protein
LRKGLVALSHDDLERLQSYWPVLSKALLLTIESAVLSIVLASALGMVVAMMQSSKSAGVVGVARAYTTVLRLLPELVQIYVWFYLLPKAGIVLSPMVAGVVALAVAFSPYLGEVFRSGVLAVPETQWEASRVLGFSRTLQWRRVVIPQAFRIVLPVWKGYVLTIFKATSLLSFITVPELFGAARTLAALNFRYFELFGLVMVGYLLVGIPVALGLNWLERRLEATSIPGHLSANQAQEVVL